MFGLGAGEILIILVFALIFIGPKKLPGLAKGLGKGMREFQNALKGVDLTQQDNNQDNHHDTHEDENVIDADFTNEENK